METRVRRMLGMRSEMWRGKQRVSVADEDSDAGEEIQNFRAVGARGIPETGSASKRSGSGDGFGLDVRRIRLGKRGGIDGIDGDRTIPHVDSFLNNPIVACVQLCDGNIIDVLNVQKDRSRISEPFRMKVELVDESGKAIEVGGMVDDGAMVVGLSTRVYEKVKDKIGGWGQSRMWMRMADGALVPGVANWEGIVRVKGLEVKASVEVFDSGGQWDLLVGKPLLERFKVIHDYAKDELVVKKGKETRRVFNEGLGKVVERKEKTRMVAKVEKVGSEEEDARSQTITTACNKGGADVVKDTETPRSREVPIKPVQRGEQIPTYESLQEEKFKEEVEKMRREYGEERQEKEGVEEWEDEENEGETRKRGQRIRGVGRRWWRWESRRGTKERRRLRMKRRKERVLNELSKKRQNTEHANSMGGSDAPPLRGVFTHNAVNERNDCSPKDLSPDLIGENIAPVCFVTEADGEMEIGTEIIPEALDNVESTKGLFSRNEGERGAFKEERVREVLRQVKIGDKLEEEERRKVEELLKEYADCFALSVSEVRHVDGAVHRLKVPEGAKFKKKVNQKPLTPPQREYLHTKINELLAAGIIEACGPGDVRCIAPTVLAKKAHEGTGLTIEQLMRKLNRECEQAGMQAYFPEHGVEEEEESQEKNVPNKPQKWRICQNFTEVNKLTEIAPMPQGDIRTKQQALSGHKFMSCFDFASGFYAVEVAEESKPYTAFYVEGKGYFWYRKMPFGLTGAPSTFADMTAKHLGDLVGDGTIELFVDDGATAADTFDEMMNKLRRILQRVRDKNLSLSASKSEFFVSEGIFAGAKVGESGVTTDPAKLTAIIKWPRPKTALNLASFLGLTGHFRDLIRNYARIEGPLRDLLKMVKLPDKCTKSTYRTTMEAFKLEGVWGEQQTKAFLELKRKLVSEPVLKAPRWDGSHFTLTTDGCQEGFAAVLAQKFERKRANGTTKVETHPIAFASKRTSSSERKYKPFLLEFAALKFGLDKFSDTIWGFPLEIETDCQALRDVLMNDKLNAAHSRWRDGILAYNIVDVRHIPGKLNVVADGLSRMWEGTERTVGDGSEWTVNEDWESARGLVNDVFGVAGNEDEELTKLWERFKEEPIFQEVVEAVANIRSGKSLKEKKRAQHRASQYVIEEGKLWRVGGNGGLRARAKVECVTRKEATEMARKEHREKGHWGRDVIKINLLDRIWSPKLDESITNAIMDCARCKGFGPAYIQALLNPVTRRHPLEMVVGDYLSMPKGKGGYHNLGVYLDVYSQHVWADALKTAGTAKTTTTSLDKLCFAYVPPETFMSDGGSHFKNKDVADYCEKKGIKQHVIAAYSPWVNGLVEGTNRLLLHVLKRLCAPEIGEDSEEFKAMNWDSLPYKWPDYLQEAVLSLNNRILPSIGFTPKELLLGRVVNTPRTSVETAEREVTEKDIAVQAAYVAQQQLDGYDQIVRHAMKRKEVFDKRVLRRHPREVTFEKGNLVQVYQRSWDYTFKTERKLIPKWSTPKRIVERNVNSYVLETLDGLRLEGVVSARNLRRFIPREGTELAKEQRKLEEKMAEEKKREVEVEV